MKLGGIELEIMRHRFQSIAEEMAQTILRTGHTLFVKQTADFGAMLVTRDGELFAIPQKTGVNTMAGLHMATALREVALYEPGDVVICNDPYTTAGMITHLPDIFVWSPVFHGGQVLCFVAAFVHSSDVGGKVPGSVSPTNTEIYQEGLRLPAIKLYRRGILNEDVKDVLFANCRIPEQNWGDISAMLAALAMADRRIQELIARYGIEMVLTGITAVLDHAEMQVRALIRAIPDGRYVFWDYMEGDQFGWPPIRVKLTLDVTGDEILCDFTGTELQVRGAFNLASYNQNGHYMLVIAFVNYFRTLEPGLPSNSGVVRPIRMYSPPGTLLNPDPPAALGVRAATMYRVIDVAMATLGRACPDVLPAAGGGMGAIILVSTRDAASGKLKVSVMQPLRGGSGGRPRQDGIEGTNFQGGWLRNIPNEALEREMPVLVLRYGLRPDSGGAGRFRGGSGVEFTFKAFAPDTTITARGMERYRFHPWGRDGGKHGTLGLTFLRRVAESQPTSIGKVDALVLGPGDVLTFLTQGGGGLGDPLERDPQRVLDDVKAGLASVDAVTRDYGVVLIDGALDAEATAARRAHVRDARKEVDVDADRYDLGPAREEYERLWTDELQSGVLELAYAQPKGLRSFYREGLAAEIEARDRSGRPTLTSELPALLDQIRTRGELDVLADL